MRLLKSLSGDDLEFFEEANEDEIQYAILSHRWGEAKDEVTYQDVLNGTGKNKKGYQKLVSCMRRACKDGHLFFWADTCCINKESSAELSEAINSMYRWYQKSTVCYVYLEDIHQAPAKATARQVVRSGWFDRGWTLQELIAPRVVWFFNKTWNLIGTKQDLATSISEKTRIDYEVLMGGAVHRRSVAQRMSWAAGRTTTKSEDRAYSLLGIFDINMPLLYGEGERAFLRLQEEIIKQDDDHTIFAWQMTSKARSTGLLASNPDSFLQCSLIRRRVSSRMRKGFKMTNRGLSIRLELTPFAADTYLAFLEATVGPRVGIFLRRLGEEDQFSRVKLKFKKEDQLCANQKKGLYFDRSGIYLECYDENEPRPMRVQRVFVRNKMELDMPQDSLHFRNHGLVIPDFLQRKSQVYGCSEQPSMGQPMRLAKPWSLLAFKLRGKDAVKFAAVGFDFDFNPICLVLDQSVPWIPDNLLHGHPAFDDHQFMPIERGCAIRQEDHDGIWYLKGDRNEDLDATLLQVLGGTGPKIALHRSTFEWHGGTRCGDIWELQIQF